MNVTKYTPGPWELRAMTYGYDLGMRGVSGLPGSYGGWFVELHSGAKEYDEPEFHETFEANARLIAAAPDLLGALAEAIMWVDQDDQGAPEMLAKWRGVISNARGQ